LAGNGSAELALLVTCCSWNFATAEAKARPDPPPDLKWPRFVNLARFHRVQGLVWNALAQPAQALPEDVKEMLSSDARAIVATNLGIARECSELQQAFQRSQTPLLFVKGLTIAALAYHSPMLKMGWDIDLLIDPADLGTAAGILSRRGYSIRVPSNPAHLHSWLVRNKESVWSRDDYIHVELHTRLADNQRLIPRINVDSPRQIVEISPGMAIPTLAEDELFAYLAVHGASSAWFRLKWISDFAAFLDGRSVEKIGELYDRSQEFGAGRAAGQALLLADALFGVLQPIPSLRKQLASDRATRVLCQAALRMLTKQAREPTEQWLGTLSIHWTQFLLQPGLGFKASELWRQAESLLKRSEP